MALVQEARRRYLTDLEHHSKVDYAVMIAQANTFDSSRTIEGEGVMKLVASIALTLADPEMFKKIEEAREAMLPDYMRRMLE